MQSMTAIYSSSLTHGEAGGSRGQEDWQESCCPVWPKDYVALKADLRFDDHLHDAGLEEIDCFYSSPQKGMEAKGTVNRKASQEYFIGDGGSEVTDSFIAKGENHNKDGNFIPGEQSTLSRHSSANQNILLPSPYGEVQINPSYDQPSGCSQIRYGATEVSFPGALSTRRSWPSIENIFLGTLDTSTCEALMRATGGREFCALKAPDNLPFLRHSRKNAQSSILAYARALHLLSLDKFTKESNGHKANKTVVVTTGHSLRCRGNEVKKPSSLQEAVDFIRSVKSNTMYLDIGVVIVETSTRQFWFATDSDCFNLKPVSETDLYRILNNTKTLNFLGGLCPENRDVMNMINVKKQRGVNDKNKFRIAEMLRGMQPMIFCSLMDEIDGGNEGYKLMSLESFKATFWNRENNKPGVSE